MKCFSMLLGIGLIASMAAVPSQAQEVEKEFLASGVTARVGGYRPVRAEMDSDGESVKKAPEDLANPKYGTIVFGDHEFGFIVDEKEEGDHALYVDSNKDGDYTNDPEAQWASRDSGELTMYSGSAKVDLGEDEMGSINLYRFDPEDPRRAVLKNTVLYYSDFGYEYTFTLDDKEMSTFVSGSLSSTGTLPIDRDENGKISRNYEMATIGEPFNFTGTPYVFNVNDGQLALAKANVEIEQLPLPPNLTVGQPALEFNAVNMDGEEVNFPKDYAGKLVMLDFWATWCGPCIREIPNMKVAYDEWHDDGFEILGISFDQEGQEEKVLAFLKDRELPWDQIYEGKYWNTSIGNMHDVSAIPFVLLVDGDSGKIIATSKDLRGEGLSDFIGEKLKEKEREGGE